MLRTGKALLEYRWRWVKRTGFPYRAEDGTYELVGMYSGAICSVIDLAGARTPDLMVWLERRFGKEITTRTWKTVGRILKKLAPAG